MVCCSDVKWMNVNWACLSRRQNCLQNKRPKKSPWRCHFFIYQYMSFGISIRGKMDSHTIFDPISTYKLVCLGLVIINKSKLKSNKIWKSKWTEVHWEWVKAPSLCSCGAGVSSQEKQTTYKTQGRYYLMSNYTQPTHIPPPRLCLPLSLSLCPYLPASHLLSPLLSMKRTQVINQEQRASGLHGPGAHYVPHNRLEAWTCCE